MPLRSHGCFLIVPAALMLLAGCRDSSVASYRVPKESGAAPHTTPPPTTGSEVRPAAVAGAQRVEGGALTWTAPAEWREKPPSSMRKGSYTVGPDAAPADVSITAFPGDVGGEVANVNRWRSQVGLPDLPAADAPGVIMRLNAGEVTIGYVDLANDGRRMLAAFVPYQGATWFFKLTGPDALVAAEKPAYLAFLRSIRPEAAVMPAAVVPAVSTSKTAEAAPAPAITSAPGADLKWSAPAHWQPNQAGSVRKGSYLIKSDTGAVADVSITAFPGDVGGELANLNRWRGQLQLPPLSAAELERNVVRQTQGALHLTIADLRGGEARDPQRLLGAIIPHDQATWFVKLVGPDALVEREKPAFLEFLRTLQTP